MENSKTQKITTRQITMIAIQSAISVLLYYFVKINLPFFPPWLDIQVSEIPALIGGFAYGPMVGSLIIVIRCLLKLPATITAGVGEFADLLLGLALVLTSSLIYKKHRNIKGALVGTILGIILSTILACFINWLVLVPAFINIANFPLEALVGSVNAILPFEVTESNFMLAYVFSCVLPFNILRYVIVGILTFVLYKKIHKLLDRIVKK